MMRFVPVVLPLLLAACASAGRGADPERARACRERGDAAYQEKDYETAIEYYTQAIGYNPDYAEAYFWRGNAYSYLPEQPDTKASTRDARSQALADYTAAIQRNPAHFDAYFNRALMGIAFKQFKAAAADLLQCTRIRPTDPEPHLLLGQLYESKFEAMGVQALDHYEQYVRLGGTNDEIVDKVKEWQKIKKQLQPTGAPPSKAPTEEEEQKAKDLHAQMRPLIEQGKTDEVWKLVDELLSKYGHTKYVRERKTAFEAMHRALKPAEKK